MVAMLLKTFWLGSSPHMVEMIGCHETLHFLGSASSSVFPATLLALV